MSAPLEAEPVLELANAPLQLSGLGADFLGEYLDEPQRFAPRDA